MVVGGDGDGCYGWSHKVELWPRNRYKLLAALLPSAISLTRRQLHNAFNQALGGVNINRFSHLANSDSCVLNKSVKNTICRRESEVRVTEECLEPRPQFQITTAGWTVALTETSQNFNRINWMMQRYFYIKFHKHFVCILFYEKSVHNLASIKGQT